MAEDGRFSAGSFGDQLLEAGSVGGLDVAEHGAVKADDNCLLGGRRIEVGRSGNCCSSCSSGSNSAGE